MYADDTTSYVIGNSVDEIVMILQEVLEQVNSWGFKNRLGAHEGKFKAMILSTRPFFGPMKPLK